MADSVATSSSAPLWPHPYGELFRQRTPSERRIVHVIWPELGDSSGAVERVASESRAVAELRSPFVLPVLDVTRDASGRMVLSYPHVRGEDLGSILARGPLPISLAIAIMRGLCAALAPLHAAGLLHRQFGPASVIVANPRSAAPAVLLLDFGLASVVDPARAPHSMLVPMTPERVLGFNATVSEDVYLIGCLGYWMVTGAPPFVAADHEELRRRHAIEDVAPVRSIAPHAPVALARAIESALTKEPDERTSDLGALDQALAALCVPLVAAPARAESDRVPTVAATVDPGAGSSEIVEPPSPAPAFVSVRPRRRPRRARAIIVGVGATVVLASAAIVGWQSWTDVVERSERTAAPVPEPAHTEVPVAANPDLPPPEQDPPRIPLAEILDEQLRAIPATSPTPPTPSAADPGEPPDRRRRTAPRSERSPSPAVPPTTVPTGAVEGPWDDAKIDEVKDPFG